MRKGIAVSPGVAVGTAYCIHEIYVDPEKQQLEELEVTAELARYEWARDKTAKELAALQRKVERQVGHEAAAIFSVHEAILRDAPFTKKVRDWIVNDRKPATEALRLLLAEFTTLFAQTKNSYLRERLSDVRDVVIRVSSNLSDVLQKETPSLTGPLIVVADELLPSQAVALGGVDVHGIVTQRGSQTSHAAIIARSRGIPAVSGIERILNQVKTGDTLIVDGREGIVIINPDTEAVSAYRKLEREFFNLQDQLAENRADAAVTSDGTELELLANINVVADARSAVAMGASGVGLYRTEYLYLTHADVPDEDEQLEVYREIIRESPNSTVTVRTLDIGGDKTVPYLGHAHQEANPFLGWRSIRLSFEHPEFFQTQIRAVLRAAAEVDPTGTKSDVRLMFPMVTTVEEMRKLRSMVRRVGRQLKAEGRDFREVPIGMMLEVPAAAATIDLMFDLVDFVSIGSNDLIQYLTAADRDNPKVNHLCQPLSPAVIRVLANVIEACRVAKKPVTLCGEMAGQPRTFVLLIGMGLRRFSMSPSFIPTMKKLASAISVSDAKLILGRVLKLKTSSQIKRFMDSRLREIAPDLVLLETA